MKKLHFIIIFLRGMLGFGFFYLAIISFAYGQATTLPTTTLPVTPPHASSSQEQSFSKRQLLILQKIANLETGRKYSLIEAFIKGGDGIIIQKWLAINPLLEDVDQIWTNYFKTLIEYYNYDKKRAKKNLRKLIAYAPEFWPARMALADFYVKEKRFQTANHHYKLLLANNKINKKDTEAIRLKIAQVKSHKRITSNVWFNIINSSNLNRGTEDEFVFINNLPFVINSDKKKQSGYGLQLGNFTKVNLFTRKNIDVDFLSTILINDYHKNNFDRLLLAPKLRLRYISDNKKRSIGIYGFSNNHWLGGDNIVNAYGLGLDFLTQLGGAKSFYTDLSIEQQDYTGFDVYDSVNSKLFSQFRFSLLPSSTQWVNILINRQNNKLDRISFKEWKYGFGTYKEVNQHLSLRVQFARGIRRYGDNHPLLTKPRQDILTQINTSITFTDFSILGFRPVLKLDYYKNNSNVSLEKYNSFEYGLQFTSIF